MPRITSCSSIALAASLLLVGCPDTHEGDDAGPPDAGHDATTPTVDAGGTTEACASPGTSETVTCGACGSVERFCTAGGTWAYGVCAEPTDACVPGTTDSRSCGSCGTQMQRCTASCVWEDVGSCAGEGTCAPGTRTRSSDGCPAGESREVLCDDACVASPIGACASDACASPGTTEDVPCGRCGTVERFCSAGGTWAYGVCEGEGTCDPGDTGSEACGCGTRTTVCDSTCAWRPFGACVRPPSCCIPTTDAVDLLFVVDNSNSMTEEQAALAAQLPRLVRALATGDVEGDGTVEFAPIGSLNVGVITTDIGTGSVSVPTCTPAGGDGVLRTIGNTSISGCSATYPSVLSFDPTGGDVDTFADELGCVATVGTGGCGFEQQLEATLKALSPAAATAWTSPSFVPPVFRGGTPGHALGANAGLIREDTLLVVILVTDEEDCSTADEELFSSSSATYTSDLNLRCFSYPSALHPVARYVNGLAQLRTDPARLLFASIVGVPLDAEPTTVTPTYDAILAHAEMVERIDPAIPGRMLPSCTGVGGTAFPPRRILAAQRDLEALGVATTTGSICADGYAGVTTRILTRIADRLVGDCP